MSGTDAERLATLEEWRRSQEEEMKGLHGSIKTLTGEISKLNTTITGWKGFTAGIAFAFTLIGGAIAYLFDFLMHKVH